MRALLIDDSKEVIGCLMPLLRSEGLEPVGVHTPGEFLEQLGGAAPDLILVDFVLHSEVTNGEFGEAYLQRFPESEADPAVICQDLGLDVSRQVGGDLLVALAHARFPEAQVFMLTGARWSQSEEARLRLHGLSTAIQKLASDQDFARPENLESFITELLSLMSISP